MLYRNYRQPRLREILIRFVGLGVYAIACCAGCRETSHVKSLPFEQQHQPTIHDHVPGPARSSEAAAEGFLHKDFFFAVSLDIPKLLESKSLEGIDLSEVQRALANWVGDRAANLANYRFLWVLLDQSLTSAFGGGNDASLNPVAIVLELREPGESWHSLFLQADEGKVTDLVDLKRDGLFAARIDSRHIAIASREMASRLSRPRETGNLQRLVESAKSQHLLQAYFDPQPIAGFFSTITQMARSIGGGNDEAFQIYTAVKHATLAIDPEQSEMVQLSISMQDQKAADQIAQSLNETFANNNNRQASPNSLAGMGNGFAPRRNSATMYEPQLLAKATALFDDIVQRDLAEVSKTADLVDLRIRRSKEVEPFLQAAISDLQQTALLGRRIKAGQDLASAVARYHTEQGRLPSDGPLDPSGQGPSFSWRVAILPQLGRQDLYDRIDFSQPWDSPTNREVAEAVPEVFASLDPAGKTAWRLSRGPGRLYSADSGQPPTLDRITDPKNRTAIIVETSQELAVPWLAPETDLPDEMVEKHYGQPADSGWLFIDAEFRLRGIKKTTGNIEAVLTVAGNERINRADLIVLPEPESAKSPTPAQID